MQKVYKLLKKEYTTEEMNDLINYLEMQLIIWDNNIYILYWINLLTKEPFILRRIQNKYKLIENFKIS